MPDVSTLNVLLHGEPIGTITVVGGDRTLFAFTATCVNDAQRPLLGLGLKDSVGELITNFAPTHNNLLRWFSKLLPEGHLRIYLAGQVRLNQSYEFLLLWVLGRDLPGAVTVQPGDSEDRPPNVHRRHDQQADDQRAKAFRFSLAGVQLRFSAIEGARVSSA